MANLELAEFIIDGYLADIRQRVLAQDVLSEDFPERSREIVEDSLRCAFLQGAYLACQNPDVITDLCKDTGFKPPPRPE